MNFCHLRAVRRQRALFFDGFRVVKKVMEALRGIIRFNHAISDEGAGRVVKVFEKRVDCAVKPGQGFFRMARVMGDVMNVEVLDQKRKRVVWTKSSQNSDDNFHHSLEFVDRPVVWRDITAGDGSLGPK
jgi:hypothetical protein